MTSVLLQFHALPCELCEVVGAFIDERDIALIEYSYPPKLAKRIDFSDISNNKAKYENGGYWLFLISKNSPLYSMNELPSNMDFIPDIYGYMRCVVGKLENGVLHESLISAESEDPSDLKTWKGFSRRISKLCPAGGAYMIGNESGKRYNYNNMRASAQAREFSKSGGRLLNVAENDIFFY